MHFRKWKSFDQLTYFQFKYYMRSVQTKLKMDKSVKQNTYSFNARYTIPGIDTLIGNWVQGSRKSSGTTFMEVWGVWYEYDLKRTECLDETIDW